MKIFEKLKNLKKLIDDNLDLLMKIFIISFTVTLILRCFGIIE
jgi:hypothetical protein